VEGWRSKFKEAKDILLVGAGAVGLGMLSSLFPALLPIALQNYPGS